MKSRGGVFHSANETQERFGCNRAYRQRDRDLDRAPSVKGVMREKNTKSHSSKKTVADEEKEENRIKEDIGIYFDFTPAPG